jgi:hypothetical protein
MRRADLEIPLWLSYGYFFHFISISFFLKRGSKDFLSILPYFIADDF